MLFDPPPLHFSLLIHLRALLEWGRCIFKLEKRQINRREDYVSNYKNQRASCRAHGSAPSLRVSALGSPCGKRRSSAIALSIFIALSILCVPGAAYAYLDPGTGSMILQALIAGLMGALVTIKIYWARIKSFFCASTNDEEKESDGNKP